MASQTQSACKLDGYALSNDSAASDVVARSLGIPPEQADRLLRDMEVRARSYAHKGRMLAAALTGDLTKCAATKTNRALMGVHLGNMASLLVLLALMTLGQGQTRWHYPALRVIGLVGLLIGVARARHSIRLGLKVAWYGSSRDMRRMVFLATAASGVTMVLLSLQRPPRPFVVVPLLLMLGVLTVLQGYSLVSTLRDPKGGSSVAYLAALDRALTSKRLAAVAGVVTRSTKP